MGTGTLPLDVAHCAHDDGQLVAIGRSNTSHHSRGGIDGVDDEPADPLRANLHASPDATVQPLYAFAATARGWWPSGWVTTPATAGHHRGTQNAPEAGLCPDPGSSR